MPRHRLGGRLVTAACGLLLATALAATPQAAARSAPSGSSTPGATTVRPDGPAQQVTVVTGDRLSVQKMSDGSYQAVVASTAPRPNKQGVSYTTYREPDGDVYVFPSDATKAIADGRLDRELFNARYLVENGYTDAQDSELPLIVRYPHRARAAAPTPTTLVERADALPGTARVRALESIGAAGVRVTKSGAAAFWSATTRAGAPDRIWLSRRYRALDSGSNAQIGVPTAWSSGLDGSGVPVAVLDTGIDETHPDLAGKVVASANFIAPGEPVTDGFGHGTHVASIVAGSAVGSDGRYAGVVATPPTPGRSWRPRPATSRWSPRSASPRSTRCSGCTSG